MELMRTALTALFSILALFAITKLIGCRQMAQMSTFDYVNGITIGSIAAELAVAEGKEFGKWLTALTIFGVITWLLSIATDRSIHMRRVISGRPVVLLDQGRLYDENFRRAHLDIQEFQMECRRSGYFDLGQIQTAVLEANGSISFLPVSRTRPATPEDLAVSVTQETMTGNVILDGEIMENNLKNLGFDITWLKKQLKQQKKGSVADIFLATCTQDGVLTVLPRAQKEHRDILE